MSAPSDLQSILDRIANGTHTNADLDALRSFGETRNVRIEGDVTGSTIFTGDGNIIFQGEISETALKIIQEYLIISKPESPYDYEAAQTRLLLQTAQQVQGRVNQYLMENQQALLPLQTGTQSRQEIYGKMMEIYTLQQAQPDFGEWLGIINSITKNDQVSRHLRELANNLEERIRALYHLFYYDREYEFHSEKRNGVYKLAVARVIRNQNEFSFIEAQQIANQYLAALRSTIFGIGEIVGILRNLLESKKHNAHPL